MSIGLLRKLTNVMLVKSLAYYKVIWHAYFNSDDLISQVSLTCSLPPSLPWLLSSFRLLQKCILSKFGSSNIRSHEFSATERNATFWRREFSQSLVRPQPVVGVPANSGAHTCLAHTNSWRWRHQGIWHMEVHCN